MNPIKGLHSSSILIIGVLPVLYLLYWQTSSSTYTLWLNSDSFSHGLLLPLITIALIWTTRHSLNQTPNAPSLLGLLSLFLVCAAWIIAKITNIQVIEISIFLLIYPAVAWTIFGENKVKAIAFPLCYPLLAAPIWGLLDQPLQNITAYAASNALRATGIPVLIEGYYISIPEGLFLIEKACGGLRFFIAAAAIGSLYAYLSYSSNKIRLIVFGLFLITALVLNWIRVVSIIWLGHVTNMEHPWIEDHYALGWWMFAIALLPLFYICSKIPDTLAKSKAVVPAIHSNPKKDLAVYLLCVITAVTSPALMQLQNIDNQVTDLKAPVLADWAGPLPTTDWQPEFQGANEILASYKKDNREISLYIAFYASQTQDAELINELNHFFSPNTHVSNSSATLIELNGVELEVTETQIIMPNHSSRLLWNWYRVSDIETNTPFKAKLLELRKLVTSNKGSAAFAISVDHEHNIEKAQKALQDFISQNYQTILEGLPN